MALLQKLFKSNGIPTKRINSLLAVINLILLLFLLGSCRGNLDCASPPPSFYFQIQKDGITYPSQKDTLKGLDIYYVTAQQTKSYVGGINIYDNLYDSGMLISMSKELNDPEFIIEIEGKAFTRLKLETYMKDSRCNSWPKLSKVYADGELINSNGFGVYLIRAK